MELVSSLDKVTQDQLKKKLDDREIIVEDGRIYKSHTRWDGNISFIKEPIHFDSANNPYCVLHFGRADYRDIPLDWAIYLSDNNPPGADYVIKRRNGIAHDIRSRNIMAVKYRPTLSREREHEIISDIRDMILYGEDTSVDAVSKRFVLSSEAARPLIARAERWTKYGIT